MPFCRLLTNVEMDEAARAEFSRQLGEAVAACTGKSEAFIMVSIHPMSCMTFGRHFDLPLAHISLSGVNSGIDPHRNPRSSEIFAKLCARALGVDAERVYVTFADVPRHDWGFNAGLL